MWFTWSWSCSTVKVSLAKGQYTVFILGLTFTIFLDKYLQVAVRTQFRLASDGSTLSYFIILNTNGFKENKKEKHSSEKFVILSMIPHSLDNFTPMTLVWREPLLRTCKRKINTLLYGYINHSL